MRLRFEKNLIHFLNEINNANSIIRSELRIVLSNLAGSI